MILKDTSLKLDIELDEETAEGQYSNLAVINHSDSEFVIDFARMMPGSVAARVKSRIILSPENAKRLLLSLEDNIVRYETVMGKIQLTAISADEITDIGFGFGEA